jgi:crotonobetainyl-CoA:carnitine CoA-transferase CaiB-like acyl-CoA transferase
MPGPLTGFRIVDLSWGIAGPIGTMMLAEQGADVVKVEPPGGDPFRALPGYPVWNRSKRSVILDFKSDDGREAFHALLATADVLVESFTPGAMTRLGFDYDQLKDAYPRLIYVALPAYPSESSRAGRPGYDSLVAAWSGEAYSQEAGTRPDGPAFLYMPMPSIASCFLVTTAVNTALFAREKTGRGQRVETSLLQGVMFFTTQIWQSHEKTPPRGLWKIPMTANTTLYECGDGLWVHVLFGAKGSQDRFNAVVGLPPSGAARMIPGDAAEKMAAEAAAMKKFARAELLPLLWDADVPAQPVQPMSDLYTDEQFRHNGMVQQVIDPDLGETTQIGVPFTLEASHGAIKSGQPRPGEHTREILAGLGLPATLLERTVAAAT